MDKLLLLLDGDMLAHRCMARHQVEVKWDEDWWMLAGDVTNANKDYNETIDMFAESWGVEPKMIWHCYTDSTVFRYKLYPGYKPNRKPKPVGYKGLKERIRATYKNKVLQCTNLEADDIISIHARANMEQGLPSVILSGDKDMLQVPGYHSWIDAAGKPQNKGFITNEQADRNLCAQVLTGDSTDGIPGCPGVGEKGAEKILADHWPMGAWEKIVQAFSKARDRLEFGRVPSEEALLQARLVRMLRQGDYDFESSHVKLWTPSKLSGSLPMD